LFLLSNASLSECIYAGLWRRHVNRKALDQYATFSDQRAELKRRQEENAKGEAKIKELIDNLDLRKDEAIERTFKVGAPHHHCCSFQLSQIGSHARSWVLLAVCSREGADICATAVFWHAL